jgi:CDP-paratose 2-epimerase
MSVSHPDGLVLITGGAGFIGTNLASRFLSAGQRVLIFDDLSRPGSERNLQWLTETYGNLLEFELGDIRDPVAVRRVVRNAKAVFHFASQVAVTTSLMEPMRDFDINARGTLNVLEAIRQQDQHPPLLFTSTNKVYGNLTDIKLRRVGNRYVPSDPTISRFGIGEDMPLSFHSPYGCSKGAADQYVMDYARTFGLPAIVLRMSCIYGPHQFGTEDQGWVAHFLIRVLNNETITLCGDGMQVRDVLYIDDLVNAFVAALENIDTLSGQAFNIGGGPPYTISLMDLLQLISHELAGKTTVRFEAWRRGDQRYYVSDTRRFQAASGWRPSVGVAEGVGRLKRWLVESGATSRSLPAIHGGAAS